jgi:acyl-CoA dehydrogenase
MVLAMHHTQVAALVRHGRTEALRDLARRTASEQLLLASATSEIGIGGDTRSSSCSVESPTAHTFRVVKQAPVISYGEHADVVMVTARRTPDSPQGDQVLVACAKRDVTLTPISEWNALGFRGTCSRGFTLEATGPRTMVLDDAFADISSQTMLPVSHLLWASLWLGIAEEATRRAQRFVQKLARGNLGTVPPGATRLAELLVVRQQMRGSVESVLSRYAAIEATPEDTGAVDFMVEVNALKVSASTLVVEIVNRAMLVCGIAGYREDSEFSLGRLLRDAHGAAVMVNNDRIIGNTAQLALAQRERS